MILLRQERPVWNGVILAIACVVLGSSRFAGGQEMELTLERVGHWGGCSTDIRIAGDRAYLAVGPRVVVLDVSSPGEPIFLGESEPLTDVIMALDIEGCYVYAATHDDGLHILEVSDPARIVHMGSDTPGVDCWGIEVVGDYAYIGIHDEILYTYDVCDPWHPVLVDADETTSYIDEVMLFDSYLYVPTWESVDIFDLSTPSNPSRITVIPTDGFDIAVEKGVLYAASGWPDLEVWDVHDPYHPMRITTFNSDEVQCYEIAISGGYLYGAAFQRIYILDVRDSWNPQYLNWIAVDPWVHELLINDNTLYAVNWYNGLATFDISTPETPVATGIYEKAAHGEIVGVHNDHAYLSGYRREIQIMDIGEPANPRRIGMFPDGQGIFDIVDDRMYIVAGRYDRALIIADIGADGALRLVSNTPLPGDPGDIVVDGDYAYIISYDDGMIIMDISIPEAPVVRGIFPFEMYTDVRLDVRYPYAYVVPRYIGQWYVVDISDATKPHVVKYVDYDEEAYSVMVADDLLFVGRYRGFDIYSIVDPASPMLLGGFWHSRWPFTESMVYLNQRIYAAPELVAVDVADPTHPRLVGENMRLSRLVQDLALVGNHLFAAQTETGLSVFEIHLIPDIDRDGRVDGADLVTLLQHYAAAAGNPDYLPAADFNENGRIDLGDLAKLLSQYGDSVE